jgi:hypothetical protein
MVARQNLVVYQGSDFRRALEFRDGSSVLLDLTGFTFRAQARPSHAASEIAFEFEFTLRDQTANIGIVDMHLPAVATEVLSISKETNYFYDIEMVDTEGDVRRIMEGQIKVYPEVTR